MITSELADGAAPELLDQRFEGRVMRSALFADEFWCSSMGKTGTASDRKSASFAAEPVCGKLRTLFDVADQPMPDSLASLADRLDAAFTRGDLADGKGKGSKR